MAVNLVLRGALEYVRNTNGYADYSAFLEDHEPIGRDLWDKLLRLRLVDFAADGKSLVLTEAGERELAADSHQG